LARLADRALAPTRPWDGVKIVVILKRKREPRNGKWVLEKEALDMSEQHAVNELSSQKPSSESSPDRASDESHPLFENEVFVSLMARLVLAVLTLCWFALWAHTFHVFDVR
jgi:hypothetical protein